MVKNRVEGEVVAVAGLRFAWGVFDPSALLVLEKCGAADNAVPGPNTHVWDRHVRPTKKKKMVAN